MYEVTYKAGEVHTSGVWCYIVLPVVAAATERQQHSG